MKTKFDSNRQEWNQGPSPVASDDLTTELFIVFVRNLMKKSHYPIHTRSTTLIYKAYSKLVQCMYYEVPVFVHSLFSIVRCMISLSISEIVQLN